MWKLNIRNFVFKVAAKQIFFSANYLVGCGMNGSAAANGPSPLTFDDINRKCAKMNGTLDCVEFHGVSNTRRDALKKEVAELFRAGNLSQLIRNSGLSALHMTEMGLFENCHALVDMSPSGESYIVKFYAQELRRPFKVSVKMEVRTTGELDAGISAKKANIFGRGESAELTFAKGVRRNTGYNFGFSAVKPFLGWQRYENIGTQIYNSSDFLRWHKTDLYESASAFLFNMRFLNNQLKSSTRLNMNWRLFSPRRETPFPVRKHAGHTTKFSLEHALSKDGRDQPVLPTTGSLYRLTTEYAPGFVGDSAFIKNIFDWQTALRLPYGFLFGASLRLAFAHSVTERSIHLLDRLYLGGPFDVRGFELNSIGVQAEDCSLGGSALFSSAVHIYAPLFPKDMLYAHCFLTTGSISSVQSKRQLNDLLELHRVSAGIGLVLNFMNMARLELNYAVPLRRFAGDSCSPGIQFGAGLNFM